MRDDAGGRRDHEECARTDVSDVLALFAENSAGRRAVLDFVVPDRDGWSSQRDGTWTHFSADDLQLPEQGWKIHVSAVEITAHQTLAIVSEVAVTHAVPFKHLSDVGSFRALNFKYAERSSAGKFITLYPDETSLEAVLRELARRLDGFPGPYVLSDVRYGNAPVFVRYGAFADMRSIDADGLERFCIRDDAGALVEDVRDVAFRVPTFVSVPDFLVDIVRERLEPTDGEATELLRGYRLVRPLHFSNGGGVYLLSRDSDSGRVVMKEGRANTGWDYRNVDAFDRLHCEYANIRALSDTGCVPEAIEIRVVGDHAFLFEEHIDGSDLHAWVSQNFPFSYDADCVEYAARAVALAHRIIDAVSSVHSRGFALMDLQPTNIIVTSDDRVRLIDLEALAPLAESQSESFLGTPGYVPNGECSAVERDQYALSRIVIGLFYPLASLGALSPLVSEVLVRLIRRFFPAEVLDLICGLEVPASVVGASAVAPSSSGAALEPAMLRQSVRAGIRLVRGAMAPPRKTMYPIDARGPRRASHVSLAYGLGGVILALGADDPNGDDDVGRLAELIEELPMATPGFLDGVLGTAVLLADRGEVELAHAVWERQREHSISSRNISMRSGLAGRAYGLMLLADRIDDEELRRDALTSFDRLRSLVTDPPETLISPGSLATNPMGLLDGWSGVGFVLAAAGDRHGDHTLHREARDAIAFDLLNTCAAPDGSLQADDRSRMLPYLADGSAGMGVALSAIPRDLRRHGDAELLQRISSACRARVCVDAGLYHGRAGLILAMAHMDVDEVGGIAIESVIEEQTLLMRPFLFEAPGERGVLVSGARGTTLGVDFAAGAAGVAHAMGGLDACSSLFGFSDAGRVPSGPKAPGRPNLDRGKEVKTNGIDSQPAVAERRA